MLVLVVGADTRRRHLPRAGQRLVARDVDLAPDAALAPRREADGVGLVAQGPAHAVDPAEAERLVARRRPSDRGLAAPLLPEADEQLGRAFVIGFEPAAE